YMDVSVFFFSSRRRHTRFSRDWSSDVCSSDLEWAKENPDAVRALCRRRSKRMRDARKVPYLDSDIFNRDNWVCQLCDKPIDPNRSEERRVGKECRASWCR